MDFDERKPGFRILGGSLVSFSRIYLDESPPVMMLRCTDSERERLLKMSGSITVSERMHWTREGWSWTDIALDGSLPEETLLRLIDQSYQLVYDSSAIDDIQKHEIDLIVRNLSQSEILEDLVVWSGLSHYKKEIERLVSQAALLVTRETEESEIGLGETKIGGLPDLPEGVEWPIHHSGKPLAFLAQINLSNVSRTIRMTDLPECGILYFFSVYGWKVEEDSDPQLPREKSEKGWTQVLFEPNADAVLQRRNCPEEVNGFTAASAELVSTISLPDGNGAMVQALNWTEDETERYDWDLIDSFKSVRDYGLGHPANHVFLGYADCEQEFFDAIGRSNLRLLFKLSSDEHASMCWGDGGSLLFWIDPEELARQDYSNIVVEYQCG